MKRHHQHRAVSHRNGSRRTKEIYRNQRPLGYNYMNSPEQITSFNMNAPNRVNEVFLNKVKQPANRTRKNVHAEERPLRIPTATRKQVRSIRQSFKPLFRPSLLNTVAEGNENALTPKTPVSAKKMPFRTSNMPNTPKSGSYNLIFGKW
jgi:hypothetical protein